MPGFVPGIRVSGKEAGKRHKKDVDGLAITRAFAGYARPSR